MSGILTALTIQEFYKDYVSVSRPVLLQNNCQDWKIYHDVQESLEFNNFNEIVKDWFTDTKN